MALTNEQITAQNFKDFYGQIRPYLNGNVPTFANTFNKSDLYSTDEQLIGRWIDGKPLYQKIIELPAFSWGDSVAVNHNVANINPITIEAYFYDATYGALQTFPYIQDNSTTRAIKIQLTLTQVQIYARTKESTTSAISSGGFAIIKYTKTTDSSMSISDGNEYSTDEQVVGHWVNGKPIYQKTFTGTVPTFTPPSDSVLDPATLDIAMDCLVDVFVSVSGFIQTVAGNYVPFPFTEITKNVTYKESSSATTLDSYSQTIAVYGRPNASTSMPNNIRVVNMNQNFNNRPLCVTAQYTKTTD